jgi:hypothetical protein
MTEQQQHLKTVIENQKQLIDEITELNNVLAAKKETAIKYQGVIEYLTQNGVSLPDKEDPTTQEDN